MLVFLFSGRLPSQEGSRVRIKRRALIAQQPNNVLVKEGGTRKPSVALR